MSSFNKGITIHADAGVTLGTSVTTKDAATHVSAGTGALTIENTFGLSSSNMQIELTVDDIDLQGSATLSAGTQTLQVVTTSVSRTIGLGDATRDMQITDTELGLFTATGGLTIGNSRNGSISVDGITLGSSDSFGTLTLKALKDTATGITFMDQASHFHKGITLQAQGGIDFADSVTTKFGSVILSAGFGSLTVAATKTFSTSNQALIITADDLTIEGNLITGTEGIILNCASADHTVGLGSNSASTSQQMAIDGTEFGFITCNGLSIGSIGQCGSQVIGNITSNQTQNIAGIVSLLAIRPGAGMAFRGGSTTFNTLNMQADAGVSVESSVHAIVGKLHLDSDYDNSNNLEATTDLVFIGDLTVSAASILTLEATQGTMTMDGALTIFAGSGVVIQESLQSVSSSSGNAFVLNADSDGINEDGTLTLFDTKIIRTNDGQITITAWDIDMNADSGGGADMDAGTNKMQIFGSGLLLQSFGIGDIDIFHFHLTDSELQHITAEQGFSLGSSISGTITVDGVSEAGSAAVGTITLVATGAGKQVWFANSVSSFNKGLTVQAGAGIPIRKSVTTKSGAAVYNAGTGTVAVMGTSVLSTTDQDLTIISDNFQIPASGTITTGTHGIEVNCFSADREVGLNKMSISGLTIEDTVLQKITANGMVLGGDQCGPITVSGISSASSGNIESIFTISAIRDNANVKFETYGSTFNDLAVQADNGIEVEVAVTTTYGNIYFDGDFDNDNTADAINCISFIDGLVLTSKAILTLEVTTGLIEPYGSLTLRAGTGIVIEDDLLREGADIAKTLVLMPDYESEGDGILTIFTNTLVNSNNADIIITAWDIDLKGTLNATDSAITIHGAQSMQKIDLGQTPATNNMVISDQELGRINTVAGLTIGSSSNEYIMVDGITDSNSDSFGTLTLVATRQGNPANYQGQVVFRTSSSMFNKGITILTGAGVLMDQSVTTKASPTLLNAGTGAVTITASTELSTTDQELIIKADDIDLELAAIAVEPTAILTGTASTSIDCITADRNVGLGITNLLYLSISGPELQKVSSTGFKLGGDTCGQMTVQGITALNSGELLSPGVITLMAQSCNTASNCNILFSVAPSTFPRLAAVADSGIDIQEALTVSEGDMFLDGDSDNTGDSITINDLITLHANLVLTLQAGTGDIIPAGKLTLEAGDGIVLNNNLASSSSDEIVLNADYSTPGNGMMTVARGKQITTINGPVLITAFDVDLMVGDGLSSNAELNTGNATVQIQGSSSAQSIGLGGTVQQMHLEDTEIGSITSNGGLTIGTSTSGDILVDMLLESSTDKLGILTLVATKAGSTIEFSNNPTTFQKGVVLTAAGGILFLEDVRAKTSTTYLNAGTGTLSVAASKYLTIEDQKLEITADDLDFSGNVHAGTAAIAVSCTTDHLQIGLGNVSAFDGTSSLTLTNSEIQRISASGLTLGFDNSPVCGTVTVNGVENTATGSLSGIVTLAAFRDDVRAYTKFTVAASTFGAIAVQVIQTAVFMF